MTYTASQIRTIRELRNSLQRAYGILAAHELWGEAARLAADFDTSKTRRRITLQRDIDLRQDRGGE